MYADYRALVLQRYQKMKDENNLSQRLILPTDAGIRDECLSICDDRYLRKDDSTFKLFFGQSGDKKIVMEAIEYCKTSKFKPLVNFLNNKTSNPNKRNIELLAWLIDFEPRPFEYGRKYEQVTPTPSGIKKIKKGKIQGGNNQGPMKPPLKSGNSQGGTNNPEPGEGNSGKPYSGTKIIKVLASIAILMSAGILIYWVVDDNKPQKIYSNGLQKCMYWADDHYEPISCNQKLGDTLVIAFDSVRLHNLKKINRLDTITHVSIGKVHYIKMNGDIEFYTAGGYHPVDPQLRLRPMTDWIYRKYIVPKQ